MTIKFLRLFIKKLTFRKLINLFNLLIEYYKAIFFGTSQRTAFPVSVSIEPTTRCNLKCPECPSGLRIFTRETGNISEELFYKITDEIYLKTSYLILYFQGEPYLHPKFTDLVNYASNRKKLFTVTSTNAHFLNKTNALKTIQSGLDKLIISIDGTTQDIYETYRIGGNLQTVKNNLIGLIQLKKELKSKTPFIVLQFLVSGKNEHQIPEIKRFAKEVGADKLELKTIQIYDYRNGNDLIPKNIKYSRYKKQKDGTFIIRSKLKNSCFRLWNSSVITWNGDIIPCCFDKNANHKFGNINEKTFKEINNSVEYKKFRKMLSENRKNIDICKNCTEGLNIN